MIDLKKLELFPKEIYAIEQFITYEYYYETVKLWEELIQYAEGLLDKYSANLSPDHRSQHPSHQADYVWGTIVLPNFKATLHHLMNGLEDLKEGFLPILRRMSSIGNDVIAQGRDYPYDWMDQVEKGAALIYKAKERIVSTRATNIDIASNYHTAQWDYRELLNEEYLIGIEFLNILPQYQLNTNVMMKTGEPILETGIYRSTEPYSACNFMIKEKKMSSDDWKLAPKVRSFENNPDNFTTPDKIEDSKRVETTWILVERVTEKNNADLILNQSKASIKGGGIVTLTGYWTTPAQPNQRLHFNKGEILPTLSELDWGEVYWYFDGEE